LHPRFAPGFARRRDFGVDLFGRELVEAGFFGCLPGLLPLFGNQVMRQHFARALAASAALCSSGRPIVEKATLPGS
jgi:hypothetical protein